MIHNPIQGIVRGEVVLDGDASGGVDLILYGVTAGWEAIAVGGMTAFQVGGDLDITNYVIITGGTPFVSGMVGKTITFTRNGPRTIMQVISSTEIFVDSAVSFVVNERPTSDTFSIEAQESLQVITLDANDELNVTDVFVSQEKDSQYAVVVDEDVPGKRLVKGRLLETGSISRQLKTPFVSRGVLKYFGHDIGLNVCLIHGYIT